MTTPKRELICGNCGAAFQGRAHAMSCTKCRRDRICKIPNCTRKVWKYGVCGKHIILSKPKSRTRDFSYNQMPSETEKAYIAGYFDGEGCLTVARRSGCSTWGLRVDFGQTQPEAILKIKDIYGGSIQLGKRAPPRRQQLRYRLSSTNAVLAFLRDISPYILEKKDQVNLTLNMYSSTMTNCAGENLKEELSRMKRKEVDLGKI